MVLYSELVILLTKHAFKGLIIQKMKLIDFQLQFQGKQREARRTRSKVR